MTAPWLGGVTRRDPSLPLTLAAIVRGAGPHGALSLADVLIAYRETFLLCYRDLSRGVEPDLSEDEIRSHLTGSLLPRLASEGWIDDTATIGWEAIQAVGDWWPAASADRSSFLTMVRAMPGRSLRAARRGGERGQRRGRVGAAHEHLAHQHRVASGCAEEREVFGGRKPALGHRGDQRRHQR